MTGGLMISQWIHIMTFKTEFTSEFYKTSLTQPSPVVSECYIFYTSKLTGKSLFYISITSSTEKFEKFVSLGNKVYFIINIEFFHSVSFHYKMIV